jgi:hypothetical protein
MSTKLVHEAIALTGDEVERREELEATIAKHITGFVEAGEALAEIREERLYRNTHKTFEDYCTAKWGMTRQHANRLVRSAEVIGNLEPIGSKPESESHVRPLVGLSPDQQKEVWTEAVKTAPGGKVTAKHVEETRAHVFGDVDEDEPARERDDEAKERRAENKRRIDNMPAEFLASLKDEDIYDDTEATPKEVRDAFLLRASEAVRMAVYKGPVNKDVLHWTRKAATAWSDLLDTLNRKES